MHIFLNKNFGKNEIFFLLSCFLIIFLQSFYLREIFYDADVAGYAYNTIEIINGRGWYASTWNNKPPGINLIFILVFSLFGKSFLSIQIAVLLANLLSAFLMYLIGKFLLEEEIRLSFLLPILYALFCVSPAIGGHTGNCEVFLAVFEIAGILFLGLAYKNKINVLYFVSGLMLGAAFIIKQAGVLTFIACLIFILILAIIDRKDVKFLISKILILFVSFLTPLVLLSIFLLTQGVFDKFINYTFITPFKYSNDVSVEAILYILLACKQIWMVLDIELIVLGASALLGIFYVFLKRPKMMLLILIWFIICYFKLLLFGIGPHHYFQIIAPFVCLSAIGLSYIYKKIPHKKILVVFFVILLTIPFLHSFKSLNNFKKVEHNIINNKLIGYIQTSQYIKRRTNPKDKIFVWDSTKGCSIYFWSGLSNITHFRVKYCFLPKELVPLKQRALSGNYRLNQKAFLSDLNNELPIYIVIVIDKKYGGFKVESEFFLEFADILNKNYKLKKIIGFCAIYKRISKL